MKYEPCTKTLTAAYQSNVNAYKQQKRCDNHSGNAGGSEGWEGPWGNVDQYLFQLYGVHLQYGAVLSVTGGTARNLHISGTAVQL